MALGVSLLSSFEEPKAARKKFLEFILQEEKFRQMVTGEMSSLRKNLDDDFNRQRTTLLAAFNEELTRALKTSSLSTSASASVDRANDVDLRSELERHRRQLDDELSRRLADSVVDLKNELTLTIKEQEKELLKLVVKSKNGNEVPKG